MSAPAFRLHHYWRSSASWRVRWALAHKGLTAELVAVNLLSDEAEREPFLSLNPAGALPVLEVLGERLGPAPLVLTESTAIIEWLEETHPTPALLPVTPAERAHVRRLAQLINSGTHPLANPPAFKRHSADPAVQKAWIQHFIGEGLLAFEGWARSLAGRFAYGDTLTLADLCLGPQVYNAVRYEVPLARFPTVERLWSETYPAVPSFGASHPDRSRPH